MVSVLKSYVSIYYFFKFNRLYNVYMEDLLGQNQYMLYV
jgi:hypothetical protein